MSLGTFAHQHVEPDASTISANKQDKLDPPDEELLTATDTSDSTTSSDPSTEEELFFEGELRPIMMRASHPRKDGKAVFTLPQVLGNRSDISFVILSSFLSDFKWLRSHFDPSTRAVFVTHGENDMPRTAIKRICANWIGIFPKLEPTGCFHMKFMLIFYKSGRLRVVITSANFVPVEYGEIENLLWLQDIPQRPTPIAHDPRSMARLDDFPSVLQRTLHAIGVAGVLDGSRATLPITVIEDLRCRWDWSKVKVELVPSIAGKHKGIITMSGVGHSRLMKAVRNLGMTREPGRLALECLSSSLGIYTPEWVNEVYHSALGQPASDYLRAKGPRKTRPMAGCIDLIFPNKATVSGSTAIPEVASWMRCTQRHWESIKKLESKFQMCDSKSLGGNNVMHSKMILGLFQDTESESTAEGGPIGWAYMGSHNFTASAWGRISGRDALDATMDIVNYEIGIVFPIQSKAELENVVFWERPAKRYEVDDEPWIRDE
ncbi:tyrosyl-DNA phosphodiesterase I [Mucidula mucida]|nr:tyrosyl-DNA phosphodiesterase I [Mucidula mucida]